MVAERLLSMRTPAVRLTVRQRRPFANRREARCFGMMANCSLTETDMVLASLVQAFNFPTHDLPAKPRTTSVSLNHEDVLSSSILTCATRERPQWQWHTQELDARSCHPFVVPWAVHPGTSPALLALLLGCTRRQSSHSSSSPCAMLRLPRIHDGSYSSPVFTSGFQTIL